MSNTGPTLVTGATGFVGSHLLDRLADEAAVVAWHRPDGREPDATRHVDWRAVNLLNADDVRAALEDVMPSRIFHIAGAADVGSSWKNVVPHLQTNVLGTHHVLEAVRLASWVCRVLVVSSAHVYHHGDEPIDESAPLLPDTPYGLSKLAQDQLALRAVTEDDLDVVIARPFNHVGPRQRPDFAVSSFARQIALIEAGRAPATIRVGNLDARRDITDVRDVVEAYHLLMQAAPAGRPYNISSGRAWKIRDLLEELRQMSQVPVTIEIDETRLRPNDMPVVQGDATRIRAELGWMPRIPVEQTLADTLGWWREQIRSTD
jgi:GDP-4-dehydro-6-deoxy-D-mannose reductase